MLKNGRISALQMAIMMHPTIVSTAILIAPSITGRFAKQDLWLSPIWGSATGFLAVYFVYKLNHFFPKKTFIEYSKDILGSFLAKAIGVLFLIFYLFLTGLVLRQYGEFVIGNFLTRTPSIVITVSMIIVCALAVKGGIEVIARTAQIFMPVVAVVIIFISILLIGDLNFKNIFPIMGQGLMPSLIGAIVPSAWNSEFFLLSLLFPFINDAKKGLKLGMITVVAVMFMLVIANLYSFFLFGNATSIFIYPVMTATRYINVADFLQHVEAFVMAVWIPGIFIKISVLYYAIVLGTAQLLNLSDYRPIVFPVGFLLTVFCYWSIPNLSILYDILKNMWPLFWLFHIAIPLILLVIAFVRKKRAECKK